MSAFGPLKTRVRISPGSMPISDSTCLILSSLWSISTHHPSQTLGDDRIRVSADMGSEGQKASLEATKRVGRIRSPKNAAEKLGSRI